MRPATASTVLAVMARERSGRRVAWRCFSRSRRRSSTSMVKEGVARSPSASVAGGAGTPEPVARHCRDLCARVPWLIASDGWLLLELA